MDTKLKKFSYGLLWVLLLTAVLSAGVMSSVAVASLQIYRYNLDSDFDFSLHTGSRTKEMVSQDEKS